MLKVISIMLFVFFLLVCQSNIWAGWVWNSETGWINTKYDPQESSKSLYQKATYFQQEKKYESALEIFKQIIDSAPNTPEAKRSLYEGANCAYLLEKYYDAYVLYEEYLRQNPNSDKITEILTREYEIGMILIRGKNEPNHILGFVVQSTGELGIEILQKLVETTPYSSFTDMAQTTIANYYFKQKEYSLAYQNYQKLLKDYPKSQWVGFAQYQMSICLSEQFHGTAYNVQPLQQSQQEIEKYLEKYPNDKYTQEGQQHLKKLREAMAQKELEIARFYLQQEQLPAVRIYLVCLLQKYGDTRVAQQAQAMLQQLPKQ